MLLQVTLFAISLSHHSWCCKIGLS